MRRTAACVLVPAVVALGACSGTPGIAPTAGPTVSVSPTTAGASRSPSATASTPATPRRLVVRMMRWRLPYAVGREAVVGLGRRVVVAGGLVAGDGSTDGVFTLDLGSGRSTASSPLRVAVHDTAGALVAGRLVVLGGGNASEQDVVQAAPPGLGAGWSVVGHLPGARSDLTALLIGRRLVVLGGYDGTSTAISSLVATSDGVHWRTVGSLPVPVRYAAGVSVGRAGFLFGGERAGVMQRAVQRIDVHGHARVVARLPVPLGHAVATRLGDRVLLAGGRLTQSRLTDRMWWFDPATRRFTPAGRLPVALADSAVVGRGSTAYLVGGESPRVTDRVVELSLR